MPDLWDSLPEEMLGERPAIQLISKQVETNENICIAVCKMADKEFSAEEIQNILEKMKKAIDK